MLSTNSRNGVVRNFTIRSFIVLFVVGYALILLTKLLQDISINIPGFELSVITASGLGIFIVKKFAKAHISLVGLSIVTFSYALIIVTAAKLFSLVNAQQVVANNYMAYLLLIFVISIKPSKVTRLNANIVLGVLIFIVYMSSPITMPPLGIKPEKLQAADVFGMVIFGSITVNVTIQSIAETKGTWDNAVDYVTWVLFSHTLIARRPYKIKVEQNKKREKLYSAEYKRNVELVVATVRQGNTAYRIEVIESPQGRLGSYTCYQRTPPEALEFLFEELGIST